MIAQLASSALALLLLFTTLAVLFTFRYSSKEDQSKLAFTITVSGLVLCFITNLILPLDIYVVSARLDFDELHQKQMLLKYVYLTGYSLIAVWAFILIPFAHFYHEEQDSTGNTSHTLRILRAAKFTGFFLLILSVLIVIGLILQPKPSVGTVNRIDWELAQQLLGISRPEQSILFLLGVLALVGMLVFVGYTAYGLAALPVFMLKPAKQTITLTSGTFDIGPSTRRERAFSSVDDLNMELAITREKLRTIRSKYSNALSSISRHDKKVLEGLEHDEQVLEREAMVMQQSQRGCWRCLDICSGALRPFEIALGFLCLLVSFLILATLIINNVDKFLHSECGLGCGYVLSKSILMNPIDLALKGASKYAPTDYILVAGITLFFISATLAGITRMGITFMWITFFKIRPGKTVPQGLLILCFLLMVSLLSLQLILFSLTPEYATFGAQADCFSTIPQNGTSSTNFTVIPHVLNSKCQPTVLASLFQVIMMLPNSLFRIPYLVLECIGIIMAIASFLIASLYPRIPPNREDDDFEERFESRGRRRSRWPGREPEASPLLRRNQLSDIDFRNRQASSSSVTDSISRKYSGILQMSRQNSQNGSNASLEQPRRKSWWQRMIKRDEVTF